jgi:aspartate/glutamate racemase
MLVGQADVQVPLLDTTELHARAAVEWALAGEPSPGGR